MRITREQVARKLAAYLHHDITLPDLVEWAEGAMMEGELAEDAHEQVRDVVARLGLADVRAFGLTWEDCEEMLRKLGYSAHVDVTAD
jgi:cobyrinic acid a,c-diamide synthase